MGSEENPFASNVTARMVDWRGLHFGSRYSGTPLRFNNLSLPNFHSLPLFIIMSFIIFDSLEFSMVPHRRVTRQPRTFNSALLHLVFFVTIIQSRFNVHRGRSFHDSRRTRRSSLVYVGPNNPLPPDEYLKMINRTGSPVAHQFFRELRKSYLLREDLRMIITIADMYTVKWSRNALDVLILFHLAFETAALNELPLFRALVAERWGRESPAECRHYRIKIKAKDSGRSSPRLISFVRVKRGIFFRRRCTLFLIFTFLRLVIRDKFINLFCFSFVVNVSQ